MNPELFIFLINSVIRVGRTASEALAQHARDAEALFPGAVKVEMKRSHFVSEFFKSEPQYRKLVEGEKAPYAAFWSADFHVVKSKPEAVESLYVLAMKFISERRTTRPVSDREALVGAVMVKQWAEGQGPVSPWVKVALAVADVAFNYVGTDSSRLGLDGSGGKLLSAFALELSNLLPDDDQLGPKQDFIERLGGLFIQAGLRTLHENSDLVIPEAHLQELVIGSLKPIIDELPSAETALSEHINYKKAAEALIGPAANAALMIVGQNQQAFFGKDLAPNQAIGALTRALIEQGSKRGIDQVFTREGLIALYQAALGVAVERPELFLGDADTRAEATAQALFTAFADILRKNPPPFDGQLGIELTVTALDTLKANAPALIDFDSNWEPIVEKLVDQVVTGLKDGFQTPDGDPIKSSLTAVELGDLAKIFVTQAARKPSMIAGDNQRLRRLVKGIAEGIRQDEAHLLTAEDWLEIASDAALNTIADDPVNFLGADFRTDRAGGALLQAFLVTTADQKLKEIASKTSLLALYQSVLRVAADQPELFIGRDPAGGDEKKAAALAAGKELFARVALTLQNNPPPFNGDLGIDLIITMLDTVNRHIPALISFDRNWDQLIESLVDQVMTGLIDGFQTAPGSPLDSILTKNQMLDLMRVFIEQAAMNPGWIAGQNQDLQRVVRSVATAMATDGNLLLGKDDWLEIARVATTEAAVNPGRLFGLDHNNPDQTLAADLLKLLLATAGEISRQPDLKDSSVLYGSTLRKGINILLHAASGNPRDAEKNLVLIKQYAMIISTFVSLNPAQSGSNEWLKLFYTLLPRALAGDAVEKAIPGGQLTVTTAKKIMHEN